MGLVDCISTLSRFYFWQIDEKLQPIILANDKKSFRSLSTLCLPRTFERKMMLSTQPYGQGMSIRSMVQSFVLFSNENIFFDYRFHFQLYLAGHRQPQWFKRLQWGYSTRIFIRNCFNKKLSFLENSQHGFTLLLLASSVI